MEVVNTKSKVIVYFPNTGVFDAMEELFKQNKLPIRLTFDDLIFIERALTDDEIKDFNLTYRIGYDGYFKIHGSYPTTQHYNVNFAEESKNRLICTLESNKYDYVFIVYKPYVCTWLNELNVRYSVVYPDNELKAEYIGNILIKTNQKYKIEESPTGRAIGVDKENGLTKYQLDIKDPKIMNTTWDQLMDKIENSNYKVKIILQRNHYLKDILDKV